MTSGAGGGVTRSGARPPLLLVDGTTDGSTLHFLIELNYYKIEEIINNLFLRRFIRVIMISEITNVQPDT